jgi:shikimate kinase
MRSLPALAEHLVLVGLMGTGKTTVGRELARRLGRPLVDSDGQIEARTGRTVREIWEADGESTFRRLESEALAAAVDSAEPAVIAAAGGVVLDPGNRELLRRAGTVVWLDADADVLVARALSGEHRPLLDEDPERTLRAMARDRRPLYEDVSDHRVDITELTPVDAAERILTFVPR